MGIPLHETGLSIVTGGPTISIRVVSREVSFLAAFKASDASLWERRSGGSFVSGFVGR